MSAPETEKWKVEYITTASSNVMLDNATNESDDGCIVGMGFPSKLAERIVIMHNEAIEALRAQLAEAHRVNDNASSLWNATILTNIQLSKERNELYEALEELKMCGPDDGVWERADAVLAKYPKEKQK